MSIFTKRQQLQKVEYVSPPTSEVLHIFPSETISIEERGAKRRRIEQYARDYLKGHTVFIASAGLKGPFDGGWVNPWKESGQSSGRGAVDRTPAAASIQEDVVVGRGLAIPETGARPVSRAGSDYCHDWLKRQDVSGYSPEVKEEVNVEVLEDGEETPSKRKQKHRISKERHARLNGVPAWSADIHNQHSVQADLLTPRPQMHSLQVDVGSSVAKRSRSEQPAQRHYREMFRGRPDPVVDSSLMKVSAITDDFPPRKRVKRSLAIQGPQNAAVESPGFVFRRVTDSKRPVSRESHHSHASTTQPDHRGIGDHPWVSVASINGPDRPAQEHTKDNPIVPEDDIAEDEIEDDEGEAVTISVNADGKWPCPMSNCLPKRPRPYASATGVRRHLKTKHSVHHAVMEQARGPTRSKSKSVETALELTANPLLDTVLVANDVAEENLSTALQEQKHVHEQPQVHVSELLLDAIAITGDAEVPLPNEQVSSPSTLKDQARVVAQNVAVASQPAAAMNVQQEDDQDSVIVPDNEEDTLNASKAPPPAERSAVMDFTGPEVPDRQDSRAYSTFTFNTQAALLQAHQAFQETQSTEKPTSSPAKLASAYEQVDKETAGAATPLFQRPGIPSFFSRAAPPPSLSKVQPASTQDLINAAADLSFSTIKKPKQKKRISFADWGQAKPSQGLGPTKTFESIKAVEWSPYVETPLTALVQKKTKDGRREISSQPETPVRSILSKNKDGNNQSSLSFSHIVGGMAITPISYEQFAQAPKSSDVTASAAVQSDENTADGEADLLGSNMGQGVEMNSLDIENVLDEAESFLSTWDVDREVLKNSNVVRGI